MQLMDLTGRKLIRSLIFFLTQYFVIRHLLGTHTVIGHSVKLVFRKYISHIYSHNIRSIQSKRWKCVLFSTKDMIYICITIINITSRDQFSSEVENLPHKMCSYIIIFTLGSCNRFLNRGVCVYFTLLISAINLQISNYFIDVVLCRAPSTYGF